MITQDLTSLIKESLKNTKNPLFSQINQTHDFKPNKDKCYNKLAETVLKHIYLFIELIGKKIISVIIKEVLLQNEPDDNIIGPEQFFKLAKEENSNTLNYPISADDPGLTGQDLKDRIMLAVSNIKMVDFFLNILNKSNKDQSIYKQSILVMKSSFDSGISGSNGFPVLADRDEIIKPSSISEFNCSDKNCTASDSKIFKSLTRIFNIIDDEKYRRHLKKRKLAKSSSNKSKQGGNDNHSQGDGNQDGNSNNTNSSGNHVNNNSNNTYHNREASSSGQDNDNDLSQGDKWFHLLPESFYSLLSLLLTKFLSEIMQSYQNSWRLSARNIIDCQNLESAINISVTPIITKDDIERFELFDGKEFLKIHALFNELKMSSYSRDSIKFKVYEALMGERVLPDLKCLPEVLLLVLFVGNGPLHLEKLH